MKNKFLNVLSVLLVTVLCGQTINAQTSNEETDLIQSIFGMEKKVIVADFIGDESGQSFWVLYDEYETKRFNLVHETFILNLNTTVEVMEKVETVYYPWTVKK